MRTHLSGAPRQPTTITKVADVSDLRFLHVVEVMRYSDMILSGGQVLRWSDGGNVDPRWVMRMQLEEAMPDVDPRVLFAKFKVLAKHGLVTGCTCGCRGDIELTEAGEERLGAPSGDAAQWWVDAYARPMPGCY